jgi:cyanophycin synthetase
MEVKRIRTLSGPNIWAYRPVLEIWLDIGAYEDLPSNQIPGFTDRLAAALPTLWEHRCSEGRPGGFLERLRMGTYMGHIVEHIILELQSLAGMDVGFGRTRGTGRPGEYRVVVDYKDAEAAKMCVDLALRLVAALVADPPQTIALKPELEAVRETAEDNMLGPSTLAITNAAKRRGIPILRIVENRSLVQLGQGKWARWIQASETSKTPNLSVEIAQDKELTKELLERVGVPVPTGRVISEVEEAWAAAQDIGLPVVVKPRDGNQGKAVSVDLTTEEQVTTAARLAFEYDSRVIVERFLPGADFRLLLVNDKLIAAAQRCPAQVVGDGQHSIRELVTMVNDDPRRGHGHGSSLTRIRMDEAARLTLDKQGLTWESVPAPGQDVLLRDNSNLSTGGTATDVTDEVHPDNAAMAVLAARTLGLDIAGVDVVCRRINRPLAEQGGGIVEVNAAPGLRMHIAPSEGKARPVGDAIIDMLYDDERPYRIPIVAISGTNGKTTVTRMIAGIFATMHKYVGMTTTDGIYFNGVMRVKGDCSGPRSAQAVLQHPDVEVAVLETARGGILRNGLGWDRCQVAVVTNVSNDHLGIDGIDSIEDLALVKQVPVESVAADGYAVLNAEDPTVAGMAEACPGGIIYFGHRPQGRVLSRHLAGGGKAVYLRNGAIILGEGSQETVLLAVNEIPATYGGVIPFQITNSLAAAAAGWGAGCPLDAIRLGLRTFQADDATAPGRFNVFEVGAARVIVDYGHNPHAVRAIQTAMRSMAPRSTIGVVAAPGDRRDSDIQELAAIASDIFETVIVREDDDLRGRAPGEVAQLIADTITHHRPSTPVRLILDEAEAIDAALEMARPNDVVVLFVDKVSAAIEQVKAFAAAVAAADTTAFACSIGNDPNYMRDSGPPGRGNGKDAVRDGVGFNRAAGPGRLARVMLPEGEDRP